MQAIYRHTNIIALDWRKLADFYRTVFRCADVPPQRSQSGQWLEDGTGVKEASLEGVHLRLPGYGDQGPTLEIYQYRKSLEKPAPAANRLGFGHIAFEVGDVQQALAEIIEAGGSSHGKIVSKEISGVELIEFVYAKDPESNLIELQHWIFYT